MLSVNDPGLFYHISLVRNLCQRCRLFDPIFRNKATENFTQALLKSINLRCFVTYSETTRSVLPLT